MDDRPFPQAALIGAGLLILTTVVGVGTVQLQKHFAHIPLTPSVSSAGALQTRALRFVDQQDGVSVYGGHVRVFDAVTGVELPSLEESDGFVRAVLNSLAFERTKRGIEAPPVFELSRWPDNRLTMTDKTTGARINLGDFGSGNKSVFFRFLKSGAPS
jgi:putative photosynthetic complex assembly protein